MSGLRDDQYSYNKYIEFPKYLFSVHQVTADWPSQALCFINTSAGNWK